MKTRTSKRSPWIISAALACLLFVLGAKADGPEKEKTASEIAAQARLEWNLKSTVEAYEKAGHTNVLWNQSAKRALTEFAKLRSHTYESIDSANAAVSSNSLAAVSAGCDDPLIRYLYLRNWNPEGESQQAVTDTYCEAALKMEKSSYPDIRKFYAWNRVADHVTSVCGYDTNIPMSVRKLSP
jgi:hypothetical protein